MFANGMNQNNRVHKSTSICQKSIYDAGNIFTQRRIDQTINTAGELRGVGEKDRSLFYLLHKKSFQDLRK